MRCDASESSHLKELILNLLVNLLPAYDALACFAVHLFSISFMLGLFIKKYNFRQSILSMLHPIFEVRSIVNTGLISSQYSSWSHAYCFRLIDNNNIFI
jgi:hypothetical protein